MPAIGKIKLIIIINRFLILFSHITENIVLHLIFKGKLFSVKITHSPNSFRAYHFQNGRSRNSARL